MEKEEFVSTFLALAQEQEIPLSKSQAFLCYEYSRILLEWNQRVNLTRITDDREIILKHFLDALLPARWLPHEGLVLDVGTGPGFPGIPLKVFYPGLRMVLLETHRKKVSFLKVVLSRLRLENTWALQGRWEAFRQMDHPLAKERYDLIVMRALELEPEHLTSLASGILRPGGIFAWWAGPHVDRHNISSLLFEENARIVFHRTLSYELPLRAGSRQLLLWKRLDDVL